MDLVIGELKYNMPICKISNLTFGSRNSYSSTHNDYTVETQTTPSNMDIFSTYNYAEFSGSIAKLNFSIGGGLLYITRQENSLK